VKEKKEKEPKTPKEKKQKETKVKTTDLDFDDEPVKKEKKVKEPKQKKEIPVSRSKVTQKFFKKFSGRSMDTYDQMVRADYDLAIERAHQLSSIQKYDYSAPVLITVPDSYGPTDKVSYRLSEREDGSFTMMYDQALVYVLFFGKDSLFYYRANVDHRYGKIGADVAGEFKYKDVVHMETELKYDNVTHPKYLTLELEIGLADSTIVTFHLRNHRIHQDYELSALLTEQEQKILNILKSKVRESRA